MKIAYLKDLTKLTDSIAAKIKGQFLDKSNLDSAVSTHNTSPISHEDIRGLVSDLTNRLNALADSDDETLDQLSEIVAYIKSNKDLIESVTTSKVSVSDIVDSLNSTATDKPLAAKQGEVLKGLIEDLKKYVSDGKTLVADAITVKGVETAADAAFAKMAENICQIETGGTDINIQESKTVSPSTAVQTITPDAGYEGLLRVIVNAIRNQSKSVTLSTSAQTVTPDSGYNGLSSVSVPAIQNQAKTVSPSESAQTVYPDSGKNGLSSVTVNAAKLQSKTVTPSSSVQTITPDSGYYGLKNVKVNAQETVNAVSVTIVGTITAKLGAATVTGSKSTNFSKVFNIPFSGSTSLGSASATGSSATTSSASVTITGISINEAASISMIAEHFCVDEELAEQIYNMDEFMIEVEEDTLEVGKIDKAQKIAQTIQAINETNSILKGGY